MQLVGQYDICNPTTHIAGQSSGFTTPNTGRVHTQLDMAKISSVKAREILDSRGNPTVEVCHDNMLHLCIATLIIVYISQLNIRDISANDKTLNASLL